ncbi:AAA family ATPase [Candidatus Woesearchaeota archaeon]|nr:AAA family ATPase [Candidatus Woesearchaeota archaeon]
MIITVTGSVGTGKTAISKKLAKKLKLVYVDVNGVIEKNKLRDRYIKKLDTYEVDISKLNAFLIKLINSSKKGLVIDSHLSHYLPEKNVDYCVVCKCDLSILKKRLNLRKYNKAKIRENLDSEIFDVCLVEALENKHEVIVIDTSSKSIGVCVDEITKKIK